MLDKGRSSKRLAVLTLLLVPAALLGFWALSASVAGEARAPRAPAGVEWRDGAFLGVELEEETEYSEGGARITRVVEDSAAERAGLEAADIIVQLDGRTIRGPQAVSERLADLEPGQEVSITVVRDGRKQTVKAALGQRPGMPGVFRGKRGMALLAPDAELLGCDPDNEDCEFSHSFSCSGEDCPGFSFDFGGIFNRPLLGVQLVHVTSELREHLGGKADAGVLVSKIVPGSPAEAAGIRVGDLIVAVGGEPVEDAGEIREALEGKRGRTFPVEVIRDGRASKIDVTLPEPDEDDAPTGPRAFLLAPHLELRGLDTEIGEALRAMGDALRRAHGRELRDALRDAREELRATEGTRREALKRAHEWLGLNSV